MGYLVLFCYSISNSSVQPFTTINYLLRFYVIVLSANEFILKFKIQIFNIHAWSIDLYVHHYMELQVSTLGKKSAFSLLGHELCRRF